MIQKANNLLAPESYRKASEDEKKKVLNECGPDGPLNSVIPNNLLGLDISESCNIHDWMFVKSESQADHHVSDLIFLNNMKRQIEEGTENKFLRFFRKIAARLYFGAVRLYSIFRGKTLQSDEVLVSKSS